MEHELLFAVLPYLRTESRVRIRGIEFRSNRDLADVPTDVQGHLSTLCDMFFLGSDARIRDMTCAYIRAHDRSGKGDKQVRSLYEAQLLIAYLYTSPQPTGGVFLGFEHASMFVFRQRDVSPFLVWPGRSDERVEYLAPVEPELPDLIPGYEGIRNRSSWLWTAPGSRIYPELPHVTLNLSQYLKANLRQLLTWEYNWSLRRLYLSDEDFDHVPGARERIFTSLDWYVRSCRDSISPAEAIVNLCTAMEALLKLSDDDRSSDGFKAAVLTILGPVPRLDWWLDQFYAARCKAVHEGVITELAFYPADRRTLKKRKKESWEKTQEGEDDLPPLQPLIDYGRRVFRICLSSIVSSAYHVREVGLPKQFVHNSERIKDICKKLNAKKAEAIERLESIRKPVYELNECEIGLMEPDVKVRDVLGTARLLLQVFLESKPVIPQIADNLIGAFLSGADLGLTGKLTQLSALRTSLAESEKTVVDPVNIVLAFLAYASHPMFMLGGIYESQKASPESDARRPSSTPTTGKTST